MYGQKQIMQCMLVIFVVSILNFYRSIIQQNKEMQRNRFKRLEAIRIKELETIRLTELRQFFIAIHKVNFECEFCCGYEILDFEYANLINEQCSVNCCLWNETSKIKTFKKSLTSVGNNEVDLMNQSNNDEITATNEDIPEQMKEENSFWHGDTMSEVLTLDDIKANYLKEDPRYDSDGETGISEFFILKSKCFILLYFPMLSLDYGKYIFNAVGLIMVSMGLWNAIWNCWTNFVRFWTYSNYSSQRITTQTYHISHFDFLLVK